MTQFADIALGILLDPLMDAFRDDERAFWKACAKQAENIRTEVEDGPFRGEVEDALKFLNLDEKVGPLLWDLLLAQPGHAALREAVRQVHPAALGAVSERRFEVEREIAAALSGDQAKSLRGSLDEIDTMMKAVTAYKSIHDNLHWLQPLLGLLRGSASDRKRWPELRTNSARFRSQLKGGDAAADNLRALNRGQQLGFRKEIGKALDSLDQALTAGYAVAETDPGSMAVEDDVRDAASQLSASVEAALNDVDVMMLMAVEQAMQPLQLADQVLQPLVDSANDTDFGKLIHSYLEFARQVARELSAAVEEHGHWQDLDRQFSLLQLAVVEGQPSVAGDINTVWRLASKELEKLCSGAPPPQWATAIVDLLCLARKDLVPPIKPPIADQARDRISELIANGRQRFMDVDQALLDWLSASAKRRPELVSLLKGDQND